MSVDAGVQALRVGHLVVQRSQYPGLPTETNQLKGRGWRQNSWPGSGSCSARTGPRPVTSAASTTRLPRAARPRQTRVGPGAIGAHQAGRQRGSWLASGAGPRPILPAESGPRVGPLSVDAFPPRGYPAPAIAPTTSSCSKIYSPASTWPLLTK